MTKVFLLILSAMLVLMSTTQAYAFTETHNGDYIITGSLLAKKGYNAIQSSNGPQFTVFYEDLDSGNNYVGFGSQPANDNDLILLFPVGNPTGQVVSFATPASVTFFDGIARMASIGTWVTLSTGSVISKEVAWTIYDSDAEIAVGVGKQSFSVPSTMAGLELKDMTCSVADISGAASGTTDLTITRVRGNSEVPMLSTAVTISPAEYTASDGIVDVANDDLALGDKLFINVGWITTAPQKGLSCTAVFGAP